MKVYVTTLVIENSVSICGVFTSKGQAVEAAMGAVVDLLDDDDSDPYEATELARDCGNILRNDEQDEQGVMFETPAGEAWVNVSSQTVNNPDRQ